MILIADIDGSLVQSIWANDGSSDQHDPAFQAALLALPALDWVLERGLHVFQQARDVMFVTGRGTCINDLTRQWVERELGIHEARIINVEFVNYQQYVADKEAAFDECIQQCIRGRESPLEMIHVIEDDPILIEFLAAMASDLDAVMIHAINKAGEHSIRYPAKPVRQQPIMV